jgi:hypothetical protein
MAKAAALSLAAIISKLLNLQETSFLSDNELIVSILSGHLNRAKPWNIKPSMADFRLQTQSSSHQVLKISRDVNVTTHNLASRARFPFVSSFSFPAQVQHMFLCAPLDPFSIFLGASLSLLCKLFLTLIYYVSHKKNKLSPKFPIFFSMCVVSKVLM